MGRYDDALRHLIEMRDLVERFGNTRLIAASRVQLGTLAIARGQLDQARTLLEEGLDLNMALRMPRNVTLSLAALAQLAFAEGNPDQATLLAGAAEGLRRGAGTPAWPIARPQNPQLATRARETLGADRFDQVFAVGFGLSQRQAAAAAREHSTSAPASSPATAHSAGVFPAGARATGGRPLQAR